MIQNVSKFFFKARMERRILLIALSLILIMLSSFGVISIIISTQFRNFDFDSIIDSVDVSFERFFTQELTKITSIQSQFYSNCLDHEFMICQNENTNIFEKEMEKISKLHEDPNNIYNVMKNSNRTCTLLYYQSYFIDTTKQRK